MAKTYGRLFKVVLHSPNLRQIIISANGSLNIAYWLSFCRRSRSLGIPATHLLSLHYGNTVVLTDRLLRCGASRYLSIEEAGKMFTAVQPCTLRNYFFKHMCHIIAFPPGVSQCSLPIYHCLLHSADRLPACFLSDLHPTEESTHQPKNHRCRVHL